MNVAAMALRDNKLTFDVSRDVNETAAIVLAAKEAGGKSGVLMIGGGFTQELRPANGTADPRGSRPERKGARLLSADHRCAPGYRRPVGRHARRGGELGEVDPAALPNTVVCYLDSTVGLPILTAYAIANHAPRKPKRLYERRDQMLDSLRRRYHENVPK